MRIKLPKKKDVPKTNPEDCLEYHYHPLSSLFYRNRIKMILELINEDHFERFLDVGSGAGIVFPELASRARHLFGIDIHPNQSLVAGMCKKGGLMVHLLRADAPHLPFKDNVFDGLLCLSTLKYLAKRELLLALTEMSRCTKSKGYIYLGDSVASPIRNMAFRVLGYNGYKHKYLTNHDKIIEAARNCFVIEKVLTMPSFLPLQLSLFFCVRCRNVK